MKTISLFVLIGLMAIPLIGVAAECPEVAPDDEDWDLDGILNADDPCCFVAQDPGDLSADVCSVSDPTLDRNGNGIPAGEEGDCCAYMETGGSYPLGLCKRASCGQGGGAVPCDNLLYYWHMPWDQDGDGEADEEVSCGFSDQVLDCICFVVGDVDGDGAGSDDNSISYDNCPTISNSTQENTDGDVWGNACDNCPDVADPSTACDPEADTCTPPAECVEFAVRNVATAWVEYYCSESPDADADGHGDACDDCPADPKKTDPGVCGCGVSDNDSDGDGTLDCNDACPDDDQKTEEGVCGCKIADVDSDTDGAIDCTEECPDDPKKTEVGECGCNTADVDSDGDTVLDCKEECPDDPEKTEAGECGCDNSEKDSDTDGVPDCNDLCSDNPDKVEPGLCGCEVADKDSDKDGTVDCNDYCPANPEKVEPGLCGCEAADDDSDKDGTVDCKDECPADPDKTIPGSCGCDKEEKDKDGDGVPDCVDNCPDHENADQANSDPSNVLGDICSTPINSYTGAFSCNCTMIPAQSNKGPIGLLITILLGVFVALRPRS